MQFATLHALNARGFCKIQLNVDGYIFFILDSQALWRSSKARQIRVKMAMGSRMLTRAREVTWKQSLVNLGGTTKKTHPVVTRGRERR